MMILWRIRSALADHPPPHISAVQVNIPSVVQTQRLVLLQINHFNLIQPRIREVGQPMVELTDAPGWPKKQATQSGGVAKARPALDLPMGGTDVEWVSVGGVLVSTWETCLRRHAEDDPLAS